MHKAVMLVAGFAFTGHTEHLAQRAQVDDVGDDAGQSGYARRFGNYPHTPK
jgi:hypothetical protein